MNKYSLKDIAIINKNKESYNVLKLENKDKKYINKYFNNQLDYFKNQIDTLGNDNLDDDIDFSDSFYNKIDESILKLQNRVRNFIYSNTNE